MQNPTHFIEVYKSKVSDDVYESVLPLEIIAFDTVLKCTASTRNLQTTFIWKIKFKNKATC